MNHRPIVSALSVLFAVGCTKEAAPPDDGVTPLAPPETGVQFVSEPVALGPGEEAYRCFEFKLPAGAEFPLVGIETQATAQAVHHFGLFTNPLGSDGAEPYDCQEMGAAWGLVSGGGVGTPPLAFPKGAAMMLEGESHVVLQLHLLNASAAPTTVAPVRVNLSAAKDTNGLEKVGLLVTGTLGIDLPPKSEGIDATGGCEATEPMNRVFAAFPHMHKLGRELETRVVPKDGSASRSLSKVTWDFSDQGIYAAEGQVALGDRVETRCTFDNPGDTQVKFGLHTSDEMCVNVLYFYPAVERMRLCGFE